MIGGIQLYEVSYSYKVAGEGEIVALHRITAAAGIGELIAVAGANAAGKSTLARILGGVLPPCKGKVLIEGRDLYAVPVSMDLRSQVGLVLQNPDNQLLAATVAEDVALGLRWAGLPQDEIEIRVAWALAAVGLTAWRAEPVYTLSGGQKQRLALAGVIARQPRYLICDEVTSMLDPTAREEVWSVLESLRQQGVGVVCVTHDTEEIERADRVWVLHAGQLVFDGPPAVLFTLPASRLREWGLEPPFKVILCQGYHRQRGKELELPALTDKSPVPLVRAEEVSYFYRTGNRGRKPALQGLNLTVAAGEHLAIMGPAAAGKTTFVQLLNGLLVPTAGRLEVMGGNTCRRSYRRCLWKKVGLVFQFAEQQLFAETVEEEIFFGLRNSGIRVRSVLEQRAVQALEMVGLDFAALRRRSPFSLSGGQRRRLALATVLALEPQLLILDEPAAGLDAEGRRYLYQAVRRYARQGATIFTITHRWQDALALARAAVVLAEGQICFKGSIMELLAAAGRGKLSFLQPPSWREEALSVLSAEYDLAEMVVPAGEVISG